ncbi:MAG: hypothetical protein DRG78_15925 [Epsilonproteobacteria bacterium]|nr:MAG: hypothetical protein DRG78_15925 [Campylobacterota bacterium]
MKIFLTFMIIFNSLLMAADSAKSNKERKARAEKQLKKEMENEKKYAKEQTFYSEKNYDFKGAEVNKDSLDSVPELEPQYDFDMDSVYD